MTWAASTWLTISLCFFRRSEDDNKQVETGVSGSVSGKKGRRKARKTDASDLTPNPQKLHNIGEQLQKLNAAIDGMGPVNDLPAVARARSRKEKNKLASRYPTLPPRSRCFQIIATFLLASQI